MPARIAWKKPAVRFVLFTAALLARSLPAAAQVVTEYPVPTAASRPLGIAAGPDGNVWFAELDGNRIGRISPAGVITEFFIADQSGLEYVTTGPDGNLWYTAGARSKVGRLTPSGVFTEFPVKSGPTGITLGSDGNLWFVERNFNIGRITPTGALSEWAIPTVQNQAIRIAGGPDGNLWFTEAGGNKVARITTSGVITEFPTPTANSSPLGIVAGPDGNMWFVENGSVGRITPAGVITEFPAPEVGEGIALGPDGALWFTTNSSRIGRITTAGVVTYLPFQSSAASPVPEDIARGPDGNLWFTELNGNQIGRIIFSCFGGPTTLCLDNRRFQVSAVWRTSTGSGEGQVTALTDDSGYFWFFTPNNVELVVKALNACGFNSRFWAFAGGLTNVEVTLTYLDTLTGAVKKYVNPLNTAFQPIQDTSAFSTCSTGGGDLAHAPPGEVEASPGTSSEAVSACADDATSLCLNNGRFRVTAAWRSAQASGNGFAVKLTGDSGYFWFFTAGNVELIVKALNACTFNNRFWVFTGGLTNVEVTLTVTDTANGTVKVYVNPLNTAYQPIQDTSAFATCP
ncbi:MAG TPA: hypothetical protein VKG01_21500 [Thermoanaerobaculia bacterium]|nr:hypothetical protein [Thermoanaerobaculia bacterium]